MSFFASSGICVVKRPHLCSLGDALFKFSKWHLLLLAAGRIRSLPLSVCLSMFII